MKKVLCNVGRLSVMELIQIAVASAEGILKHPETFTNPFPNPHDLIAKAKETQKAHTATGSNARIAFARRNVLVTELKTMLRQCINYVNLVASGNDLVIIEAGFLVSHSKTQGQTPERLESVKTLFTNHSGTIQLKWNHAKYASFYQIYITTTPEAPDSWKLYKALTGRQLLVEALTSGTRYYFKIVPINNTIMGPISNIVTMIAA